LCSNPKGEKFGGNYNISAKPETVGESKEAKTMRCVLCGGELRNKIVEEEVSKGGDSILTRVKAEVCVNCNERYYPEGTIDRLIQLREKLEKKKVKLREIGKVYKVVVSK